MSASPNDSDEQGVPPKSSQAVILLTIADTTWRMFVPSVGLTLMGLWLDGIWQTMPWLMLAGAVIGLLVAVFAVKMQLKKLT